MATVEVEAFVDDAEKAGLHACRHDGVAGSFGQLTLVANFAVESPDSIVPVHSDMLEYCGFGQLWRIELLIRDACTGTILR